VPNRRRGQINISMTESRDPLENVIAEGIDCIINNEYFSCYEVNTLAEARSLLGEVIKLFNQERPHMSLGMLTPERVHAQNLEADILWKLLQEKTDTLNLGQDNQTTVNL